MKIRTGFVSNSSSSSFIAELSSFDSTLDIAKEMIPLREWGEQDDNLVAKVNELSALLSPKTPIIFSSCNYDTHIYITEIDPGHSVYVIDTCHNHPFHEIDGFEEMRGNLCREMEEWTAKHTYYDIELDLWYKEIPYGDSKESKTLCEKHHLFVVEIADGPDKGSIVCPACYAKKQENKKTIKMYQKSRSAAVNLDDVLEMEKIYKLWRQAIELTKKIQEVDEDQKIVIRKSVNNIIDDIRVSLLGEEE